MALQLLYILYHHDDDMYVQLLQVESSKQDKIRWWEDLKLSQRKRQKNETPSKNHGNPDNSLIIIPAVLYIAATTSN